MIFGRGYNKKLLILLLWSCCTTPGTPFSTNNNPNNNNPNNNNNIKRHISAAQKARIEEETRRKERSYESIPGKTSAIPGSKDFEINVQRTESQWDDLASGSERQIKEHTANGLHALRTLKLEQADTSFQTLYQIKPNAYCWQAGVVKFYLGDYYTAAQLFAQNAHHYEHKFNMIASEERIWRDACELKLNTLAKAMPGRIKRDFILDPPVAQIPPFDHTHTDAHTHHETRKVLRISHDLFASSIDADLSATALARAKLRSICGEYDSTTTNSNPTPPSKATIVSQRKGLDHKMWRLNSWFYLGLHYDVTGDILSSKECMKMALRQCISGNGNDIIHALPMLHMARRDWFDDDEFEEDDGLDEFNEHDVPVHSPGSNDTNAIKSIETSVDQMKLAVLQESLRRRNLKTSGSKSVLKQRLLMQLFEEAGLN